MEVVIYEGVKGDDYSQINSHRNSSHIDCHLQHLEVHTFNAPHTLKMQMGSTPMVALNNIEITMNAQYSIDLPRYRGGKSRVTKFLFWTRVAQNSSNPLLKIIARLMKKHYGNKYGLEISWRTKIGKGLYIGHAYNITIHPDAVIGDNCSIHKGIVIGQTNRGKHIGVPTIGNEVWIGINASVVGGITIGDDVLIAPNTFVNVDIPSHSVVFGNPCIIKHRDNATEGYIEDKV